MQADKQEQELLYNAIDEWTAADLLTAEQAARLKSTVVAAESGRQQLAGYFFIIAVSCALLAFSSLFIDEKLLQQLQRTFLLQNITIAAATGLFSIVCFWQARRRRRYMASNATYELSLLPGTLTALISLVYICKDIGNGQAYSLLLGLMALMFLSLSTGFRSRLLWIGFILAAMGWFGAFSSAFSHDNLFLGMNYPVRFTVFGLVVLAGSFAQRRNLRLKEYYQITYHAGLLITFTGMWGLSVFGNYGHLDEWAAVRQTQVLGFAILFAAAAGAALYLGIRYNDTAVRDYSVLFLLLNLYTRYFEYFWNSMNKGLFFLFLALSFWLVGRWLAGRKTEAKQ